MPAIHRHSDARSCGATTVVTGQGDVYSNGLLVSVNADPNSHSAGGLIATCNNVYVNGIIVCNHSPDSAVPDTLCFIIGPPHCAPATAGGSPNVFVGD